MTVLPGSVFVVLLHARLGQIPNIPTDDGFVMVFYADQRHLSMVGALFMGQIIRGIGFLLHQIAYILFILQNLEDGMGVPFAAAVGTVSFAGQETGDFRGADLLHRIFPENQTDKLCAVRFQDEFAVHDIIAQHGTSKDYTLFHLPGLSPNHAV